MKEFENEIHNRYFYSVYSNMVGNGCCESYAYILAAQRTKKKFIEAKLID